MVHSLIDFVNLSDLRAIVVEFRGLRLSHQGSTSQRNHQVRSISKARQIKFLICLVTISICLPIADSYGQYLCPQLTENINESFRQKVKKSKKALIFQVSKNLTGELRFSNLGLPLTIQMSFNFKDSLGYSEEAGQLLTIEFKDGSSQQLIPSSKKTYSGTVFFMLIKPKDKHQKILSYEDMIFFEKLRNFNIESFKLGVSDIPRVIIVSTEQADIIKKIVGCLVE